MPAISGWSSGIVPQPIRVGITGTPVSSANATSASAASALMIPPPATMSGRSACASMSSTFAACAGVARGLCTGSGAYVSGSNSISVICTSNGRSMSTGPGRPERMRWKACWNAPGTWAGSSTVIAIFVSGAAIAAMSMAWKSSLWSLATGAWPVMQRMGMESAAAEYRPVIMSVPAGPEVPMQIPMLPAAARVKPSAMCAAPSTWRASTWRIPPCAFIAE